MDGVEEHILELNKRLENEKIKMKWFNKKRLIEIGCWFLYGMFLSRLLHRYIESRVVETLVFFGIIIISMGIYILIKGYLGYYNKNGK